MVSVLVYNTVTKENEDAFLRLSLLHKQASLENDAGCRLFEVCAPKDGCVVFIELWDSQEALSAHAKASKQREHLSQMDALREAKRIEVWKVL